MFSLIRTVGITQVSKLSKISCLSLAYFVAGCAGGGVAIVDTFRYALPRQSLDPGDRLNPTYPYLRVVTNGEIGYLARGAMDSSSNGITEVWYSADREVLKLSGGRITGVIGSSTEWRDVTLKDVPSWETVLAQGPQNWTRFRDVMPGYRMGVVDLLSVSIGPAPSNTNLIGLTTQSLTWFYEIQVPSSTMQEDLRLPVARYAVDLHAVNAPVIYAEQCLQKNLCISWQRWPVESSTQQGRRQ